MLASRVVKAETSIRFHPGAVLPALVYGHRRRPARSATQLQAAAPAGAEAPYGVEVAASCGAAHMTAIRPTGTRDVIEATGSGRLDVAFFPPDGVVAARREIGAPS